MENRNITITCVGHIMHRYIGYNIKCWDFDYNDHILRIDFKDGSFIEFYKQNIICVEVSEETINDSLAKEVDECLLHDLPDLH